MRVSLTYIALACLCASCTDQFERINRYYVIENNTSHSVEVELWEYGLPYRTSQEGKGVLYEGLATNDAGAKISAGAAIRADSIVFIFNDERRQIYYYDRNNYTLESIPQDNRHPLMDEGYELITNELYKFILTEEDYQNAEPIEN